jgi:hypothetical protein
MGKTTKVINDDFETIELRFNNAEFGDNIQVLIKKINAEQISFEFFLEL